MANGLLGKKLVNVADTELVYTVPSAKVATFNFSILNNAAQASTVNVYISDANYQTADFSNYTSAADSFTSSFKPRDIIGTGLNRLFLTSDHPTAKTAPKKAIVDHAAQTWTVSDVASTLAGEPLPFYYNTELYVRDMYAGAVYTFANYISGGSATTAATNWGFTGTDNILWATNVEADNAVFYVKGSTGVNSIADYRSTTNTYGTYYQIPFGGSITSMVGVKTNSERFIVGMSTGNVYWSSQADPSHPSHWNTQIINNATGVSGTMVNATSSATKVYAAFDTEKIMVNTFGTTDEPLTGWTAFDFPSGKDAANLVDMYHDGTNLVLQWDDFTTTSTADDGTTWGSAATAKAKQYLTVDVSASKYRIEGVKTPEVELVKGHTYVFQQIAATNNTHPLSFSTTQDGTHASSPGTAYSTGMTFKYGNPTATAEFAGTSATYTDWTTNHATYNGEPSLIEFTVPSDAPATLYAYCSAHSGMGFTIKCVDAPAQTGEKWLSTQTIWDSVNEGAAIKKIDVFADGTTTTRLKRFNTLNNQDLYDKATLSAGEVLERTGVMASAGEQLLVTTTVDGMVVRAHGIEE